MDLDAAADALYGAPPEEFVTRRQDLVVQARAAKDRALATAIGKLRRPTKSAWLVNRLSRDSAAQICDLFELGERLREAQEAGDGGALRTLSAQRQAAMAALVQRAAAYAEDAGQPMTDAQRQEVTQTLQAALADPEATELVRRGRVVQPLSYGGFGTWAPAAGDAEPSATAARQEPAESPASSAADEAAKPTPDEVRAAHDAWLAARRAVTALTADLERARDKLQELDRQLEEWRVRVATAEQERQAAADAVRSVERDRDAARREADERAAAYAELHQSV